MALSDIYANTQDIDFTINFFNKVGKNPKEAYLAAPFFTYPDPIEVLLRKGCHVRLIIRFSPTTTPEALQRVFDLKVKVRYFTDANFHTKLYIVDDVALVGSANLTQAGLLANRELSVLLKQDRDEAFNDLCGVFNDLWEDADVLNEHVLREYTRAFKDKGELRDEVAFAKFIHDFIEPARPRSVDVKSREKPKERAFIQRLRRKYDEVLGPAYDEIFKVAKENGIGGPEFEGQDPRIEMDRFLCWLPQMLDRGNSGQETTLLGNKKMRAERIAHHVQEWQSTSDTEIWGMYPTYEIIESITNIRTYLCDPDKVRQLSFDGLFKYLAGCTAFHHREQYAPKGIGENLSTLERMRIDFQRNNSREGVVRTINYLLSDSGDKIERAYDCIYGNYKLYGFGEACVMELLGWGDRERPPFNNRSIRGIRLLGFEVEHSVVSQ